MSCLLDDDDDDDDCDDAPGTYGGILFLLHNRRLMVTESDCNEAF